MESLRHLVGDPWLSFVTIAIVPGPDSDPITRFQESTSPFYTLYSRGAKVLSMPLESSRVQEVLLEFEPSPPLPRWTQKVRPSYYSGRPEGLDRFIEEITKVNRTESSNKTKRPPKITLEESEASRQQLQDTLDQTEAELQSLRSQLEQTQLEYASLRSELQLNDNTEQSKVVQSLNDLNRTIDDFGRSVAEYMVDNFAAILNKDDPTALDASNFTGLQRQFGHQGGKPSLAASSRGEGLPIEDVIDLALRSFLCQMLYKSVFLPFYPTLTTSAAPGFMDSLYEEIRRQVSPTVAAKWRASSFVALSQGNKFNHSVIESQVESLVMSDIQQLLSNIFGGADTVTLTDDQRKKLQDIVTLAWEFNYMLKGEVVTLGDFQPLCYERGTPFNPKTMVEFEPDKKRKPGDIAISTVRLGITLSYSKGIAQHAGPLILINAAFGKNVRELSNGFELATQDFHFVTLGSGRYKFMLVDSPGFDNTSFSDAEVMTRLIRFLCCGKALAPVTGVIYVHPQEGYLGSGILKRNMLLLRSLLGDSFLNRLTVLLVHRPKGEVNHQKILAPLLDSRSPFRTLYDLGARVETISLETQPVRDLLLSFAEKGPEFMSVQNELSRSGRMPNDGDISTYLTKCARIKHGAHALTGPKVMATGLSQIQNHISSSSRQPLTKDIKKLEVQLAESKKQAEDFSSQLQQHLSQYTALCSQLQIHENTEQSAIVQNLIDINRRVEDLALSLSQYLVDTYGGQDKTTTQYAAHLSELKLLFEHDEKEGSLVQSSKGEGMLLDDFLDVAIRSILCEQLYKRIFAPFHPGLSRSDPRDQYTIKLYNHIKAKGT
ncbi:hypothetical protein BN14_09525 [Rhizoctonia solani AG-1 IB]|uniref:G domain-containing protein n=1 Tax=Thanatephorus cucumeris (strain AG1-IB / isolate 7/3/14) TaxID=1108050 RepID=M5CG31_THACB|nr:hypothetical protein BN14_09525 [Rhizoctonia solani AG-1 IB]